MSDPITCIKKPEPPAHTPGPWAIRKLRSTVGAFEVYPTHGGELPSFGEWAAIVEVGEGCYEDEAEANARLIANAPALLAHAEKSLMWLIAERDCHYEGCSIKSNGQVLDIEDQMTLDHYDRDIEQLRALIAACKGEA